MIQSEDLSRLATAVSARIHGEKRLRHTLCVADAVGRLCDLYAPDVKNELTAAALLHDVTKELTPEEQVALARRYDIPLTDADIASPKTLHARTAEAVIKDEFSEFATPLVLNAVRWHTTGRVGMTLTEKLLYLADYIDDSRTYENCVRLRNYFYGAKPDAMSIRERLNHLDKTLLLSFDMTITDLLNEGGLVCADTTNARNELILKLKKEND